METEKLNQTEKRIIKRYSNRKLYDTRDSRYVTLQQIGEMVRCGDDVQIIDNKTKEDKTEVTLALILSEDLKNKPKSVPLNTLRNLIQERGEKLMSTLREGPLGRLLHSGEEGELQEGAEPTESAPEQPVVTEEPTEADADKPKGRLEEIVATSRQTLDQLQATLDDRVKAVVPGMGLTRELREELAALTQRVDAIEAKRGMTVADSAED